MVQFKVNSGNLGHPEIAIKITIYLYMPGPFRPSSS
jgi:hypothetical protein